MWQVDGHTARKPQGKMVRQMVRNNRTTCKANGRLAGDKQKGDRKAKWQADGKGHRKTNSRLSSGEALRNVAGQPIRRATIRTVG